MKRTLPAPSQTFSSVAPSGASNAAANRGAAAAAAATIRSVWPDPFTATRGSRAATGHDMTVPLPLAAKTCRPSALQADASAGQSCHPGCDRAARPPARPAVRDIPDPHLAILRADGQPRAVGAEGDRP